MGHRTIPTRTLQGKHSHIVDSKPESREETSNISDNVGTKPSRNVTWKAPSGLLTTLDISLKIPDTQKSSGDPQEKSSALKNFPKFQGVGLLTL